jgi:hypothetical protein
MAGKADLVNSIVDSAVVYVPEIADDGEWQQVELDLGAALVGAS